MFLFASPIRGKAERLNGSSTSCRYDVQSPDENTGNRIVFLWNDNNSSVIPLYNPLWPYCTTTLALLSFKTRAAKLQIAPCMHGLFVRFNHVIYDIIKGYQVANGLESCLYGITSSCLFSPLDYFPPKFCMFDTSAFIIDWNGVNMLSTMPPYIAS